MTTAQIAAKEYQNRQERKTHPQGTFDKAGRWYPDEEEHCNCCNAIRSPSRAYPYSYMTHCRTKQHVANLYGVSVAEINAVLKAKTKKGATVTRACANGIAYKKLAIQNGRLVSIFDGSSWRLGQERREAARQGHNGGLYVYQDRQDAHKAPFPDTSACIDLPQVIVKCRVAGSYCRYGKKLAFSRVTPLDIVDIL